jgi:Tol biopolymer transport system component
MPSTPHHRIALQHARTLILASALLLAFTALAAASPLSSLSRLSPCLCASSEAGGENVSLPSSPGVLGVLAVQMPFSSLLPDGSETKEGILFTSDRETPEEFSLYTMNADGSEQKRLGPPNGVAFDPALSPDGKQILFSYVATREMPRGELRVLKAGSPAQILLVTGEEKTIFLSPAWSPDGKRIAYTAVHVGDDKLEATIWVVDTDGNNRKKLGEGVLPAWSPDSKQLLFSQLPQAGGPQELKIMDADGSHVKGLKVRGLGAAYSPDGKRIAFIGDGNGRPNIFVMDADGSHGTQLTRDPETMAIGPTWEKDGKHLLFTRIPKDTADKLKMQICRMDTDGGNVTALTKDDSYLGIGVSLAFLMHSMPH